MPGRRSRTHLLPGALIAAAIPGLGQLAAAQVESDPGNLLTPALDVAPVADVRLRGQIDASRDLRAQPAPTTRFPLFGAVGAQAMVLERYGAKLTLGAAGGLGDRATVPGLFLDEGYLEVRLPWGDSLTQVRVGRQAVDWSDGRLVSAESHADRPRRIDAARLSVELGSIGFDAFASALDSQPQLADRERTALRSAGEYLGGAAARWQPDRSLTLDGHVLGHLGNALAAQDDPQLAGDERRPLRIATVGFAARAQPAALLQVSSALDVQVGEARGLEHQAIDASSRLALSGPWPGHPTLQVGYDHSSGARHPSSNHSAAFDTPLAEIHARYGAADLLRPSNAQDVWIAARLAAEESWLALSAHRLALASAHGAWVDGAGQVLAPASGATTTLLGYEVDIEGSLKLAPQVTLELLYALFVPDGLARSAVGPRTAHRLLVGLAIAY